jgi:hypothetical protein
MMIYAPQNEGKRKTGLASSGQVCLQEFEQENCLLKDANTLNTQAGYGARQRLFLHKMISSADRINGVVYQGISPGLSLKVTSFSRCLSG